MFKRVFVVGDIHGRLSALNEVLEAVNFHNYEDRLITLGDICDGGSKTKEVVDRLLQIVDRIDVIGNHDLWFRTWIHWKPGDALAPYINVRSLWEPQGGIWTQKSYGNDPHNVPYSHAEFFQRQVPYYIDDKNRVFVHGGFNPKKPVDNQPITELTWNRKLITYAKYHNIDRYEHVFVGHTSTQMFLKKNVRISNPITYHNLTMCDCGAGWSGRLALVNVDFPKEYVLSEFQEPNYEPDEDEYLNDMTEEEAWGRLP